MEKLVRGLVEYAVLGVQISVKTKSGALFEVKTFRAPKDLHKPLGNTSRTTNLYVLCNQEIPKEGEPEEILLEILAKFFDGLDEQPQDICISIPVLPKNAIIATGDVLIQKARLVGTCFTLKKFIELDSCI